MELNELRKIAEAATPGPWEKHDLPVAVANSNFTIHAPNAVGVPTWTTALPPEIASTLKAEDAEFVATFDPETVLALLSRLEQAEQAVARVREVASEYRPSIPEEVLHEVMKDILRALDGDGRG